MDTPKKQTHYKPLTIRASPKPNIEELSCKWKLFRWQFVVFISNTFNQCMF